MANRFTAATVPPKIVRASNTTLFHIAMEQLGDALDWTQLATFNNIIDPWIFAMQEIEIPPVPSSATPTGILTP
jgi:hypothetical protein